MKLSLVLGFFAVATLKAAEPAWCDPRKFDRYRIYSSKEKRIHVFRIGKLVLAGMPIGNLDVEETIEIAEEFSRASARDSYCTWYVRGSNVEAEEAFIHRHLPPPASIASHRLRRQYVEILNSSFAAGSESFVRCAEQRQYIALGCDQMRHRGPTAFAMLLAFSGCSPAQSSRIANRYWGLNFVPAWVREGVALGAYDLGQKRAAVRARLQRVMR